MIYFIGSMYQSCAWMCICIWQDSKLMDDGIGLMHIPPDANVLATQIV